MKARHFPRSAIVAVAVGAGGWLLADHTYWESFALAMLTAALAGFLAAAAAGVGFVMCFPNVDGKTSDRISVAALVGLALVLPATVAWKNAAFPPSAQEKELIELLNLPPDSSAARDIISDLGKRGPAASYTVPALRKIAGNPVHHSRDHAIWALQEITGHELSRWERLWVRDASVVVPAGILFVLVLASFYLPAIFALFRGPTRTRRAAAS